MSREGQTPRSIWAERWRAAVRWWPLALIVAVAGTLSYLLASYVPGVETLRYSQSALRLLAARQPALAAAALIGATAIYLMLSLPVEGLLTAASGMFFGTVLGSLLSVIGTVIAALLLFFGLRLALARQLTGPLAPRTEALLHWLQRDGANYLLLLRLLPVLPFALVSLMAVLVRMRFWPYTIATTIGVIPPTVVFASAGSGLGAVLAQPGPLDLGGLLSWRILLPLAGFAVLALLPVGVRHWRARAANRGRKSPPMRQSDRVQDDRR